jgi:hypothetical protein
MVIKDFRGRIPLHSCATDSPNMGIEVELQCRLDTDEREFWQSDSLDAFA